MQPNIDLVVTRHRPLVALLRERGIITDSTPVIEHASISDVRGKHVLGVLPHHLSQHTASITEIPMVGLTREDREAMSRGDLSLDRTREVAGDPVTYRVYGPGQEWQHRHDAGTFAASSVSAIFGSVARIQRGQEIFTLGTWAEGDSLERLAGMVAADISDWGPCTDCMGPDFEPTDSSTYREWHYHGNHAAVATCGRFVRASAGTGHWGPWVDLETLYVAEGDPVSLAQYEAAMRRAWHRAGLSEPDASWKIVRWGDDGAVVEVSLRYEDGTTGSFQGSIARGNSDHAYSQAHEAYGRLYGPDQTAPGRDLSQPLWRLEGRDGFVPAPWLARLRFIDEAQAWTAAEMALRTHPYAEGPFGVQAIIGPVPLDDLDTKMEALAKAVDDADAPRREAHLGKMLETYGSGE